MHADGMLNINFGKAEFLEEIHTCMVTHFPIKLMSHFQVQLLCVPVHKC